MTDFYFKVNLEYHHHERGTNSFPFEVEHEFFHLHQKLFPFHYWSTMDWCSFHWNPFLLSPLSFPKWKPLLHSLRIFPNLSTEYSIICPNLSTEDSINNVLPLLNELIQIYSSVHTLNHIDLYSTYPSWVGEKLRRQRISTGVRKLLFVEFMQTGGGVVPWWWRYTFFCLF